MFNVYDSLYDRQLQMVTPNEDNSIVLAQDWNENKIYADTTKAASLLADSAAMSLFKQFLILETVVESEVFHVVKLKYKDIILLPTHVTFSSFLEKETENIKILCMPSYWMQQYMSNR